MERKSIGSFIAALRRANGMTQKELAERLAVTDKAVSRWECEESLPDLMLIPVMAEVFGITTDELLSGEKRPAKDAESMQEDAAQTRREAERVRKQTARLLKASLNRAFTRQCAASAIGLLAVIVACVCNFALDNGFIGFCLGLMLIIAGVALSLVFARNALQSTDDEDIDQAAVRDYRIAVTKQAMTAITALLIALSLCLPFARCARSHGYAYINEETWTKSALYALLAAFVALSVLCHIAQGMLAKRDLWDVSQARRRLQRGCLIALCVAELATLIAMPRVTGGPLDYAQGMTFDSVDAFVAFAETPTTEDGRAITADDRAAHPFANIYFDEQPEQIFDGDGRLVCEYTMLNRAITSVIYGKTVPPITVYLAEEEARAFNKYNAINDALRLAMALEMALTAGIYLALRRKTKAAGAK